jgi:hypothetical protein
MAGMALQVWHASGRVHPEERFKVDPLGSESQFGFPEDQVDDVFLSAGAGERPELALGAVAAIERIADEICYLDPIALCFKRGPEKA